VHPDPSFIHQHLVDAYTAQHADEHTKPIALAFALIGLYLYLEKNYTGKAVQRAHVRLGWRRTPWPRFDLPEQRGNITAADVLAVPPGPERDAAIRQWCVSVWDAYRASTRKWPTWFSASWRSGGNDVKLPRAGRGLHYPIVDVDAR